MFVYKKSIWISRKKFFTPCAIINLIENVEKLIDNKLSACEIFHWLAKSIWYRRLLHILTHYEIRDFTDSWFSSYLPKRNQFFTINGFNSEMQNPEYGIPKGSVLGPLIFFDMYQWSSECNKIFSTTSLCR